MDQIIPIGAHRPGVVDRHDAVEWMARPVTGFDNIRATAQHQNNRHHHFPCITRSLADNPASSDVEENFYASGGDIWARKMAE